MVQVFFWNLYFRKLSNYHNDEKHSSEDKLTILVCAKNESSNLQKLIPSLLSQNHKESILIVDDFSTDDSLSILDASANENSALNYLSCSKNIPGKKQALMDGLSAIKDGSILLIDADCNPASDDWSRLMSNAASEKEIVLGFSPYEKTSGFLNRWIRYEAILTGIQYLSFALMGRPYMGVGRNLLYKKQLVHKGERLKESMHLASGDDDLLINKLANKSNYTIQITPKSWVYSKAKTSWKDYFNQKRRHMSTASSYKFSDQLMLLLFSVSWILLYACIVLLFVSGFWLQAVVILILRWITSYLMVIPLFTKLDGKDCIAHWWYLDPFTALYFLIFSIFAIIPQRNNW